MLQTVMIADDSMPLHTLIRAQFRADRLSFHSVYDGEEAVSLAASLRPDLILMDIEMPNMDGFEACRRIKVNPVTASIPILFLSANSFAADRELAFDLGAFDYIKKPFRPERLRACVRSKLQAVPVSADGTLVDPLTGLWNHAYFEVQLTEQYALAQLGSRSLACILTEIDQLGVINFRFGPAVANQVVRKVARLLSGDCGGDTTLCCLPNHRFASLIRNSDRFGATRRAERMKNILQQKLVLEGAPEMNITCSFGICDNLIASAMALSDRAADVLDRAANRGGNCVAVARASAVPLALAS
jgi:diguanylate cyclase (GGDEF)-like protein